MGNPNLQIAIVTDDPGWHGEQLTTALNHHGLNSRYLSLTECQLMFDDSDQWVRLPGFEQKLPLGIFVRGVPGGTLEQVIFRLDVLHVLVDLGVVVYNSPRAIERTVDKAMTSFLLKQSGLPTPGTWIFESLEQARMICQQEFEKGHRLVLKPLFGSQGIGIHLIDSKSGLIHDEKFAGLYYLQSFVERGGTDWFDIRVFIIDGKAQSAMLRRGISWITNRARGARCEPLPLDTRLCELAESAARAVNADYAGVDLIPDAAGQLQVIEVNGVPAWWGLQSVTEFNIATNLIDHFVRRIGETHALTVQS